MMRRSNGCFCLPTLCRQADGVAQRFGLGDESQTLSPPDLPWCRKARDAGNRRWSSS